jgi:hypothetical protein
MTSRFHHPPPGGMQMKSFQVATKNHDGGSSSSLSGGGGRPDAFALYSNQEVRMDRLLFRTNRVTSTELIPSETDNDDMDTSSSLSSTAKKTCAPISLPRQPPRRRVTRLSFEVHPSLLDLEDPLLLLADNETMTGITRPNFIFDE